MMDARHLDARHLKDCPLACGRRHLPDHPHLKREEESSATSVAGAASAEELAAQAEAAIEERRRGRRARKLVEEKREAEEQAALWARHKMKGERLAKLLASGCRYLHSNPDFDPPADLLEAFAADYADFRIAWGIWSEKIESVIALTVDTAIMYSLAKPSEPEKKPTIQ